VNGAPSVLVLDLDDTLVDTSHVYWLSRSRFVTALTAHGIDPVEAVERFEAQDSFNMNEMGFSPARYQKTMADVYGELVRAGKLKQDNELASELSAAGQLVLNELPELIEGSIELLAWARERFAVILLTRGVEALQQRKILHLGLSPYLDEIRIVRQKGPEEFAQVIAAHNVPAHQAWVIGDSIRSDINPAIRVGARPVLYAYRHHSYYWRQEYGVLPEGPFFRIKRLVDAIPLLENPSEHAMISAREWMDSTAALPHPGA
jgi:putative hydrolase of the HAD superfamily